MDLLLPIIIVLAFIFGIRNAFEYGRAVGHQDACGHEWHTTKSGKAIECIRCHKMVREAD